jgi:hypothetical protein
MLNVDALFEEEGDSSLAPGSFAPTLNGKGEDGKDLQRHRLKSPSGFEFRGYIQKGKKSCESGFLAFFVFSLNRLRGFLPTCVISFDFPVLPSGVSTSGDAKEGFGEFEIYDECKGKGNKFIGHFKGGVFHGKGHYTWKDGVTFDGHWSENKYHGFGALRFNDESDERYEGMWKDDAMHGQGTYHYSNSDSYEGEWENDQMNGQGRYTFASGNVYVGQWQDNKMNGVGKMLFQNGDIYDGQWKDGHKHGKGVLDSKVQESTSEENKVDGEGAGSSTTQTQSAEANTELGEVAIADANTNVVSTNTWCGEEEVPFSQPPPLPCSSLPSSFLSLPFSSFPLFSSLPPSRPPYNVRENNHPHNMFTTSTSTMMSLNLFIFTVRSPGILFLFFSLSPSLPPSHLY